MFEWTKNIFIGLLTGHVNGSNHTKRVLLSNQKCINIHPNENSQESHYYPFSVILDRYVGSCNTINDVPNKICAPNKAEDLSLIVSNMITGICEKDYVWNTAICNCKNGKYLASIMND